eukprot:SAG22_NODE_11414_length_485_cov_0.886305_1_plen_124_part_10
MYELVPSLSLSASAAFAMVALFLHALLSVPPAASAASDASTAAAASVAPAASCSNLTKAFGSPLAGQECWGLTHTPTGALGNPIKTAQECGSACCAAAGCSLYNFKLPLGPTTRCWTGSGALSK